MSSEYFPTKDEIFTYLQQQDGILRKKQMADDMHVDKNRRAGFRRLLQNMEKNGDFDSLVSDDPKHSPKKTHPNQTPDTIIQNDHTKLSGVGVFVVERITNDGDVLCRPENWIGIAPTIYIHGGSPTVGNRVLARIKKSDDIYVAKTIKIIENNTLEFMGILEKVPTGFHVVNTDKRDRNIYFTPDTAYADTSTPKDGDIVTVIPIRGKTNLLKNVRLQQKHAHIQDAHAYSLLAILKYKIPYVFPADVLQQTQNMTVPPLDNRTDLRDIPLVTIDGEDARDFDDAVYATPTDTGYKILIAIADVSHYVPSHTPLDDHALERGNSTYFADRVVPMLPEALSNGLCSLVPHQERACLAVWIDIDNTGEIKDYTFVRGLMKSHARLTYEHVQKAYDGHTDTTTAPMLDHIHHLYNAYALLDTSRQRRGTLELEIPEKYVTFDADGHVSAILPRHRLASHKLIEEFMICANVAATKALQAKKQDSIMYRIHDIPPMDKMEILQSALHEMGLSLPKGTHITPTHFTTLLHNAKGQDYEYMLSELVLRSQSKAEYNPDNVGHFGLALQDYCHFTSPIRRYSDILIHRAIIETYHLGDDGISPSHKAHFHEIAETISNTERRSQRAEQETLDRYLAKYLETYVGSDVTARISGITERAIFLTLSETGADAVVFLKNVHWDYFIYVAEHLSVIGERTKHAYSVGDMVVARICHVSPIKGGIECIITDGGTPNSPLKIPQNTKRQRRFDGDSRKRTRNKKNRRPKKH